MKRHISAHVGYKPYKCDHCSYSSAQISNLGKHFKIKHGIEQIEPVKCRTGGKRIEIRKPHLH